MPDPRADELNPTGKDTVEGGASDGDEGAPATVDPAESHLGDAGDPAEG